MPGQRQPTPTARRQNNPSTATQQESPAPVHVADNKPSNAPRVASIPMAINQLQICNISRKEVLPTVATKKIVIFPRNVCKKSSVTVETPDSKRGQIKTN
jgi:hypothetical protein